MVKTNLSSKGQVTIPLPFRKRMNLTGRQAVELDQLPDGTVMLRPIPSVLDLAGGLRLGRSALSSKEERKLARKLMTRRSLKL